MKGKQWKEWWEDQSTRIMTQLGAEFILLFTIWSLYSDVEFLISYPLICPDWQLLHKTAFASIKHPCFVSFGGLDCELFRWRWYRKSHHPAWFSPACYPLSFESTRFRRKSGVSYNKRSPMFWGSRYGHGRKALEEGMVKWLWLLLQ